MYRYVSSSEKRTEGRNKIKPSATSSLYARPKPPNSLAPFYVPRYLTQVQRASPAAGRGGGMK